MVAEDLAKDKVSGRTVRKLRNQLAQDVSSIRRLVWVPQLANLTNPSVAAGNSRAIVAIPLKC